MRFSATLMLAWAHVAHAAGADSDVCCPGKFVAKGRGSPYPPMGGSDPMVAFDFNFFADDSRLAQRASAPDVDMGTLYLSGVGHFYWTNSTNCRQLGLPTVTKEYFCVGGTNTTWSESLGQVTLPGGTVLDRWAAPSRPWHQLWTVAANGSGCLPVMEMGFGDGFGGQVFFYHVHHLHEFDSSVNLLLGL